MYHQGILYLSEELDNVHGGTYWVLRLSSALGDRIIHFLERPTNLHLEGVLGVGVSINTDDK